MKKNAPSTPVQKKVIVKAGGSLRLLLEQWCRKQRRWIMAAILAVSLALRMVYFQQVNDTVFINQHTNPESDMSFFHLGAVKIADGDWLSKTVGHPRHQWMQWVADRYFQSHPEKLEQFRAKAGSDTLANNPAKLLWEQWYGSQTFQQEPLYSYFVAVSYSLFGKNVRWVFIFQLLMGIFTNLLVYLVARRYFGDLAGTVAAFMAVFFGPMLFYEMILLRSSMAVFSGILLIYVTGTAIQKNSIAWWILTGILTGLALMVHMFFLFFLLGTLMALFIIYRKNFRKGIFWAAALILGLFVAISPVIYRNYTVGASPMSLSSTGALSFVTMNNESFKSFIGWNINAGHLSEIMGETDGRLLKAILPTLKTHPSAASYLSMEWDKFHATFSWFEIPNNVNFYLYRDYIPVLFLTFLSFLVLSPLALTGIFLSLYKKTDAWPLYLMYLVFMFPMLAFMVLSRYRIILVPVLIPFAALTVVELLESWKGWKNYAIVAALVLLGFWASSTGGVTVSKITRNDYTEIWSVHYTKNIQAQLGQHQWDKVARSIKDFLSGYEPGKITNAGPSFLCRDRSESDIFDYFSMMHGNLSRLYHNIGDSTRARTEGDIAGKLKNIASRQPLIQ